jgi:hypothetical protein
MPWIESATKCRDVALPGVFSRSTKQLEKTAADASTKSYLEDDAYLLNIPGVYEEKQRPKTRDVGVQVNLQLRDRKPKPAPPREPNHDFDIDDIDLYFPFGNPCTLS